jgi:hypothetical protein
MQRLVRYCAGWVVAASVATTVSYAAIQNTVRVAALGAPVHAAAPDRVLATPPDGPTGAGLSTSTSTSTPTGTNTKRPHKTHRSTPTATSTSSPSPTQTSPTPTASSSPAGKTHGYSLQGGQVVLDLESDSAQLVSAVPAAGFQAQTVKTEFWVRVDFISDSHTSTLVVSWYQHAPTVQTSEDDS